MKEQRLREETVFFAFLFFQLSFFELQILSKGKSFLKIFKNKLKNNIFSGKSGEGIS